jgi:hypothetical protein
MNKPVSLDAALRRVSRKAEQTFNKAVSYGDNINAPAFGPIWIAWTADGEEQILPPARNDRDYVTKIMPGALREYFREIGAVRYATIAEIWVGTSGPEVRPSKDPNRTEAIQIMIEDLSGERIIGMRKIVRPPGRKPYLEALEVRGGSEMIGRFCDLLLPDFSAMTGDQLIAALSTHKSQEAHSLTQEVWRRLLQGEPRLRYSLDLPDDDQDRGFFARIPGVPIGVTGRRDPGNGELCIGGIGPDLDAEKLAEAEDLYEMVSGEEAEALISLVVAKLQNNGGTEDERTIN